MEFFLYYVLWPTLLGAGVSCTLFLAPGLFWPFLGIWLLAYFVWPLATPRRLHMQGLLADLEEEAKKDQEKARWHGVLLALGPWMVMFLAIQLGMAIAPTFMEVAWGIDIQAKIEEAQEHGEGN